MDRKKGNTKFELILLYHYGYKPKEIIELGYSRSTAYIYHAHYKKALAKAKELKR